MCHSFFPLQRFLIYFSTFLFFPSFFISDLLLPCVFYHFIHSSQNCVTFCKKIKKTKLLFMNLLPYIGIKKEPFIWLTIQTQESRSCTAVLDISIIFSFPNVVLITQKTTYGFITSLFGIKIHILSLTQQMSRRKQQTKVYHLHMWGWWDYTANSISIVVGLN